MDVLKVFNMVVCSKTNSNSNVLIVGDLVTLLFAPLSILFSPTRFIFLAYLTIFIFFVLIYSSQSTVVKKMTAYNEGIKLPVWANSLILAVVLYVFQAYIILLFLKFSICDKTMQLENDNFHLTLQQYDNEDIHVEDGY